MVKQARAQESAEAAGEQRGQAETVKVSPETISKYGLKVEPARKQVLVPTVSAPARFAFNEERTSRVSAAVNGRVASIAVRVGDAVGQGDELAVISSPELAEAESEYLQRRSGVDVASNAAALAKSGHERAKALYESSRGITLTEMQKRDGEARAAAGAKRVAESTLTTARNKLHLLGLSPDAVQALEKTGLVESAYTVRAPIAGRVVQRNVALGELSKPERDLFTVVDTRSVWVIALVPEAKAHAIAAGAPATVHAATRAAPIQTVVARVSPEVDPLTRSVEVRLEVPNEDGDLKAGLFTRVDIALRSAVDEGAATLALPEEGIQTIDGKPSLFVPAAAAGSFARRVVSVGPTVGGMVPVLSGLREGEPVVVAGTFILKAELGKSTLED